MNTAEKQPIGCCYICSQGWAVIVQEILTRTYFVYCNECETEWTNPIDYQKQQNETRFTYGEFREPDDKEILQIGWEPYLDQRLKKSCT